VSTAIANIFRIPELRKKILYTLGMLIIFRIGAHITIPGINPYPLAHLDPAGAGVPDAGDSILNLIDLFAGGAFKRFSIFALGIMPYISSSIIMQLLMVVIPTLQKMQREGEEGRKKITQITRYGTILLCAVQSIGVLVLAGRTVTVDGKQVSILTESLSPTMFYILGISSIIAGTMLLMWMGEQMTAKGIGNGISLLIFAGIVVRLPQGIVEMVQSESIDLIKIMILLSIFFILIVLSIYLTQGTRKVPLQYGKRMMGRRMVQAQSQSLPFKVNSANVMPIIFASSLMLFPQTIGSMMANMDESYAIFAKIARVFTASADFPGVLVYYLTYSLMIIFFAYFYTAIQYNPEEIAENLKKYGGFIPGIRPGSHTRDYIQRMLNRITLPGSIFLAGIALAPQIVNGLLNLPSNLSVTYTFGGTSLLIMVGVALETLKQIEAQLLMRHYDGFMKKGKIRGRVR
jgi:preprotein translocase subunit SecY